MIIDTHAHVSFPQFEGEVLAVLERAKEAGVEKIVNVGCDPKSCKDSVRMVAEHENVYGTLGMHPYEAAGVSLDLMREWEKVIAGDAGKKIVAIGECGLDYFKADVPREVQKEAFRLQVDLAKGVGLPLIVHNRNADEDCLEILDEMAEDLNVVFHCYGSDLNFAQKLWQRGIYTSFTGIITYPNARNLHEVVREVPMDLFMVETDCPYLAPQNHRGERNEPAYVVEVVREVARLKGKSFKEIARVSTDNAERFFKKLI
ncbi:TatD family hydrolase [Patescibacteria group bacterium]|nr:TatD family hydrolase [Patescibacteria group bacterium]